MWYEKTIKIAQHGQLSLNSLEDKIFSFLRQANSDLGLNCQMLVAGGWVRDKLLNVESDDIDIAIDMLGYDFAQKINEYAKSKGIEGVGSPHRLSLEKSADPSETPKDDLSVGGIDVFGLTIELVPMRKESYNEESRTPSIELTNDPKEDVLRRDLTINAMYYNIATGQVDDYVGGMDDLGINGSGVINLKTPDDAKKTFMEDPLRMLRALRFFSRYPNSQLDPSIIGSMQDPEIHEAWRSKVSPSRCGKEMTKMMEGEKPADALEHLLDSGLYNLVFTGDLMGDVHQDGIKMDQQTPYHKYSLMKHTIEVVRNMNDLMNQHDEPKEMRGTMNMAAVFHDFGKMFNGIQQPHFGREEKEKPEKDRKPTMYTDKDGVERERMGYFGHEEQSAEMSQEIMTNMGINPAKKKFIDKIIRMHMRPHKTETPWTGKSMGKFIRNTKDKGLEETNPEWNDRLWKYVWYHAQADNMGSGRELETEKYEGGIKKFEDHIQLQAEKGVTLEPLVNGTEIMQIITVQEIHPKTGYIREINEALQGLQDDGSISTKEEGIAKIWEMKPELIQKYNPVAVEPPAPVQQGQVNTELDTNGWYR